MGTTPVLTEFGRESGLLQASLDVAHSLRGRTNTLDKVDRKIFPLNLEILEGVNDDPIAIHMKFNEEIAGSKTPEGYPAGSILEARGIM